jgi:hypothetical protein
MVEVPEEAGVAVALRAILPVTVELLAGAVQATVGASLAFALFANASVPPRVRAATTKAREILIGITLKESVLFSPDRLEFTQIGRSAWL